MHFYACLTLKPLFPLKKDGCKLHKAACHPIKCDIINDVQLFATVYRVYTVANFLHYPIRRSDTIASAVNDKSTNETMINEPIK